MKLHLWWQWIVLSGVGLLDRVHGWVDEGGRVGDVGLAGVHAVGHVDLICHVLFALFLCIIATLCSFVLEPILAGVSMQAPFAPLMDVR